MYLGTISMKTIAYWLMLKNHIIILFCSLFVFLNTFVNAQTAEDRLSLAIFSQMKQLKTLIPIKSKFETNEEYQRKINTLNLSPSPITIELKLFQGEYNSETQQLKIKPSTSYEKISSIPKEDRDLAPKGEFPDDPKSYSASDMLRYRRDEKTVKEGTITCVNGFGAKFIYKHRIDQYTEYMINTVGKDVGEITLNMPPQEARKYFTNDESRLNGRLKIKLVLEPVSPYYSYYTTYGSGNCPNSEMAKAIAEYIGMHISTYSHNHLIYARLKKLEVIDQITSETIYDDSFDQRRQQLIERQRKLNEIWFEQTK